MTDKFSFKIGKQEFNIDFTKIKGGMKKEDLQGVNESIFNNFAGEDGVLDALEIRKMKETVAELAGKDEKLTTSEAAGLKIGDKRIGREAGEEMLKLLKALVDANTDVERVEVLDDGTETVYFTNGNRRETTPLENGGKVIKDIPAENTDFPTVTTVYDNNDNKVNTVSVYNSEEGVETSTYKYENNEPVLVKQEIQGDGYTETKVANNLGGFTTTRKEGNTTTDTVANDNDNVVLLKITHEDPETGIVTETTTKNGVTTVLKYDAEGKLLSETVNEDGVVETREYDENKKPSKTTKIEGGKITTVEGDTKTVIEDGVEKTYTIDEDGNHLSQTIDGKTVEYDGNGNTKVIVQNEETISQIARKFGCTVQELLELNDGLWKQTGNVKWFPVGAEIVVPGEIDPGAEALEGRKDAKGAKADYEKAAAERAEAKAKAEAEAKAKAEAEAEAKAKAEAEAEAKAKAEAEAEAKAKAGAGTPQLPAPAKVEVPKEPELPAKADDKTPPPAEAPVHGDIETKKVDEVKNDAKVLAKDLSEDTKDLFVNFNKIEEFDSKITPGNVAHVITQYPIEEGSGRTPAQELFEDLNSNYTSSNIYKSLVTKLIERANNLGLNVDDHLKDDNSFRVLPPEVKAELITDLANKIIEFDNNVGWVANDGKAVDFDTVQDLDDNSITRDIERDNSGKITKWVETQVSNDGKTTTTIKRDANGEITSWTEETKDDNDKVTQYLERDKSGKVTYQTDYTYNEAGKLTRYINQFGEGKFNIQEYEYTSNNKVSKEINRNDTGIIAWKEYQYNEGSTTEIYRDENGNMTGFQVKYTEAQNEFTEVTEYYNANGELTEIVGKKDGKEVQLERDENGELKEKPEEEDDKKEEVSV